MIRSLGLSAGLAAALFLAACAQPRAPTVSYIDVAAAPALEAPRVEQGRILAVQPMPGHGFAYTVERLRDESLIKVDQPDERPLPRGLKVYISYGAPVTIEAAPTTPDLD